MMRFRKLLIASAAVLLVAAAQAQEPIRFARTPDISPDGKLVTFSYLGDIWVVEAIGGIARPVTMHEAHDVYPNFSPDGRQIAFTSNRHGSYDIFVVPVEGGKPRRLTYDSGSDVVTGWSPDGKSILFTSNRQVSFPANNEMYAVPVDGGRVRRVSVAEGREGIWSPRGDEIAYVRGPGTWYRKGYRGSSNDDIWICSADGSNNRRLTHFPGQDNSPMWSADSRSLFYVSECLGTPANIVRQDLTAHQLIVTSKDGVRISAYPPETTTRPQPLTMHKEDNVRRARISATGEWIVYECGPDLWVVSTRSGTPRKLAIEVHADDKSNTERMMTFTQGATEFALSPDEKHVAFVVHGDLFLIPIAGGKATRLTSHPAYDHGIAWAPDGKKIIFLSDRDGQEDLYLLEPDDPDHPDLVKAHLFKVKRMSNTPEAEFGVSFAPDGKRVAFIRAGQLWTMNPDGSDPKVIVSDVQVFDYDWSPDSKSLVYARMDGSFASELYIVPSAGGTSRNITRHATYNGDVSWSHTGNRIGFLSQRRRNPGMFVLSLQKPAAPGAPATSEIDWDDIHLRVEQASPIPAEEGTISADGTKVAFRSVSTSGDDLWVASANGSQLTRVTTGNMRPQHIRWSRRLPDLLYFRDGTGSLRLLKLGFTSEATRVPFLVRMVIKRDEEFSEMFEQSWRALSDHFYDPKFHGADWKAVRDKYRPLVKHVALKEDLYALISLMMGELNASHLGIAGQLAIPEEVTADLGLLFDESWKGPGLKIAEIIKRGPADKRGINLKAGDIILSIDRTELTDQTSLSRLLNGKVSETVVLHILATPGADPKDPKARRRLEMQAGSREQVSRLLYERWVDRNARRVVELSKGTLGYIHIPSMDDAGLDQFVRALYSDNFDKEAIVIDVRFNGGGFTHDQVLNYLGAREHTIFRQRHGGEGAVLRSYDRKWSKPLILLINNRSYSDAEIFPSAFRTLGLGKLVGQPTGAFVIGTSSIRLIDGSSFRVPRTGVFTVRGENMEKVGVTPDVIVEPHPDQLARGQDPQLDKAVEVLLEDVANWKKNRTNVAAKPPEGKPATTPPAPVPAPKPTGN